MMGLYQSQRERTQQNLALQARLIAQSAMLQRSGEEFEVALAAEVRDNPAIEIEERVKCPRCGKRLQAGYCAGCDALALERIFPGAQTRAPSPGSDEARRDSLAYTQAYEPFAATVLRQLRVALPREDVAIATYLTGSLDEHGFLAASATEVAVALKVDEARVERAIAVLRSLDPPGVGSRTVTECLLRQLESFEERGGAPPAARALIQRHLTDLAERRFERIARSLRVSVAEIQATWEFIRQNLAPYPTSLFDSSAPSVGAPYDPDIVPIWPDVVFRRAPTGFNAEIIERSRFRLAVQPLYAELSASATRKDTSITPMEARHIRASVARAEAFLILVRRRWETLGQIASALAVYQRDFFERGVSGLRPLTRLDLARRLGVSESTVSRASSGKFALLPMGRVISFEVFFDASLPVKERLLALVGTEDSARPLRDDELARLLDSQGVRLAPRTVAKYRAALGIAAPRLRAMTPHQ
jgi:RNA polymerase sigma-54 factor